MDGLSAILTEVERTPPPHRQEMACKSMGHQPVVVMKFL